jgi:hypothetical protein
MRERYEICGEEARLGAKGAKHFFTRIHDPRESFRMTWDVVFVAGM